MHHTLPAWVQWLQALGLPTLAAAGVFVAFKQAQTAALQARIAKAKAQHDTFDKKYEIYEATRDLIGRVLSAGECRQETLREFYLSTAHAQFVFPTLIQTYLDELVKRVTSYHAVRMKLEAQRRVAKIDEGLSDEEMKHSLWLHDQLPILHKQFYPYLRVDQFLDT